MTDEVEQSCQTLRQVANAEVLWSYEVEGDISFRMERYLCQEGRRQLPAVPCPIVGVQFGGKKVLALESDSSSAHEAVSIPSVTLIIPGNNASHWEVNSLLDFVMIYFRGAAQQKYRALIADLQHRLALNDALTGVVAKQLAAMLSTGKGVDKMDSQRQAHMDSLAATLFYQVCYILDQTGQKLDVDTIGARYPYIYEVLAYVRDNLDQPLSIAELADKAGLKQSYFREVFKRVTGLPPHSYVNKARLKRAHELLVNSEISIAALTEDLGFSNQSHLTTAFKKHYGVTPAQYRRQKMNKS